MMRQSRSADPARPGRLSQFETSRSPAAKIARLLAVVVGIVAGQAILYGPSLVGARILLPLDVLAENLVYVPRTPDVAKNVLHDRTLTDLAFYYEPARQFAIAELRAGRLPFWSPFEFGGVGCYRWTLSPPWLLGYLIESPVVLAWIQLLTALLAGGGAYLFFRHVVRVVFWPAAIAAWCYPLTGAFVIWQGFWLPAVMCWLPWLLLAVEICLRRPAGWGGPALALLSGIVLLSGAVDIGGQVLLASGVYAVCRILDPSLGLGIGKRSLGAAASLSLAWVLGILASACMFLPLAEYMQTGSRPVARSHGSEERPPVGMEALPEVVLPDMYGSTLHGSYRIGKDSLQESSAGGYAGLLATLFLLPLGWSSRGRRSICIAAVILAVVGLSWTLNIPILLDVLRMPGLNLMSHNRFVFVTAFAILVLATVGLNSLWEGKIPRRSWHLAPAGLLAALMTWCVYRIADLPQAIATSISDAVQRGEMLAGVPDMAAVLAIQTSYRQSYAVGAAFSLLGLAAWGWLSIRGGIPRWAFVPLAGLLLGELLWFGYGRASQSDPALYYPRLPILERIAATGPGRVIGMKCLPANLASTHGVSDVRGYDGVDPTDWVELLKPAADPTSKVLPYAQIQWMDPKGWASQTAGVKLSPILSMLNVRYVIYRGPPAPGFHPALVEPDYFVWENPNSMPRVYVPLRVETVADREERLVRLSDVSFDPRQTAYIEQPVAMPAACQGSASITEENPQSVTIAANMLTPGLVVLADRWDAGWTAYLGGKQVPILRTNHAVRGVVVPAGRQVLQFRYEPATLARGSVLSGLALLAWLAWVVVVARKTDGRRIGEVAVNPPSPREVTSQEDGATAPSARQLAATPKHGRERHRKGRR
jgi:hypothetical protein